MIVTEQDIDAKPTLKLDVALTIQSNGTFCVTDFIYFGQIKVLGPK